MGIKKDRPIIMVVDDEKANIDVLAGLLTPEYRVVVAINGLQALKRLTRSPLPDLILLDIMMPEMDGYEVCQHIKKDERTNDIPVIFVSARGDTEDEMKGLKLGAVDYITKPLRGAIVKARVANHIELKLNREHLKQQNELLKENMKLREDVERITRHDLKTPLCGIISLPDTILYDDRVPSEHLESLKAIRSSGYKMLNMINLSLDLVKMEQGSYKLSPALVNIHVNIQKIIQDLKSQADSKNSRIILQINHHEPEPYEEFYVVGEELLCYSMAANLIKNAVEACPSETDIHIHMKNDDSQFAQIQINNQGMVPKTIQDKFFEKYATHKKHGTGLGTYSAKLMAETMNGSIQMQTDETEGTTITINLPAEILDL